MDKLCGKNPSTLKRKSFRTEVISILRMLSKFGLQVTLVKANDSADVLSPQLLEKLAVINCRPLFGVSRLLRYLLMLPYLEWISLMEHESTNSTNPVGDGQGQADIP